MRNRKPAGVGANRIAGATNPRRQICGVTTLVSLSKRTSVVEPQAFTAVAGPPNGPRRDAILQHDALADEKSLEGGTIFKKLLVLFVAAEAHHVLNAGPVMPSSGRR